MREATKRWRWPAFLSQIRTDDPEVRHRAISFNRLMFLISIVVLLSVFGVLGLFVVRGEFQGALSVVAPLIGLVMHVIGIVIARRGYPGVAAVFVAGQMLAVMTLGFWQQPGPIWLLCLSVLLVISGARAVWALIFWGLTQVCLVAVAQHHAAWIDLFPSSMLLGVLAVSLYIIGSNAERAMASQRAALSQNDDALKLALIERDRAEELSRAKGRFLASISHELRTPLNAIIGYAELLQEELESQEQAEIGALVEDAVSIHESGRSLLRLVDEVLDLTRIEGGAFSIVPEEVDVMALVRQIELESRGVVARRHNRFALDVAACEGMVLRCDRARVHQVLSHLIANAAKFTEQGQITLRATCVDGVRLCFEVRDTGIGIAPEDQSRIFERFVQLDGSTTRRYDGTGLGLALCHQLVEMMAGELRVESAPGEGSSFFLELPLSA